MRASSSSTPNGFVTSRRHPRRARAPCPLRVRARRSPGSAPASIRAGGGSRRCHRRPDSPRSSRIRSGICEVAAISAAATVSASTRRKPRAVRVARREATHLRLVLDEQHEQRPGALTERLAARAMLGRSPRERQPQAKADTAAVAIHGRDRTAVRLRDRATDREAETRRRRIQAQRGKTSRRRATRCRAGYPDRDHRRRVQVIRRRRARRSRLAYLPACTSRRSRAGSRGVAPPAADRAR